MADNSKVEQFKYVISEFFHRKWPDIKPREIELPTDVDKVIALFGVRRAGKTYVLYDTARKLLNQMPDRSVLYVNLDDDRLYPLSGKDMQALVDAWFELAPESRKSMCYLLLDEVQVVADWERFVRRLHDSGQFRVFVTGSSSSIRADKIATSLRGRTLTYELFPLSFREFLQFHGVEPSLHIFYSPDRYDVMALLKKYIEYGGFPEVVLAPEPLKKKILQEYLRFMFYNDVVEQYNVRNRRLARHLLLKLLSNIGTVFSVAGLYKCLKQRFAVSRDTIAEYIQYMCEAGLFREVRKFSMSVREQETSRPKYYCVDVGLVKAGAFVLLQQTGRLVENIVCLELLRRGFEVYYWKAKHEVDFVVAKGSEVELINVHWASTVHPRELKGFEEFKKVYPALRPVCTLITSDLEGRQDGARMVPLLRWLVNM